MKKKIILLSILVLLTAVIIRTYMPAKTILVEPRMGPAIEAIYAMGIVRTHKNYDVKVGILTSVEKLYVREGQLIPAGAPLIKFRDSGLIRAPFEGTIIHTPFREAETVTPQATALSMADLMDLYLEISLEQEGALKVRRGQKARVTFEGYTGGPMMAEVKAIFPRNDEFIAHIQISEIPTALMPGMSADVAIIVREKASVLKIPVNAINNGQVTIYRDGKRQVQTVTTGLQEGPYIEVTGNDIQANDLIEVRKKR
jgi:membrane fusion protein, macrolide-specific efflux system